MIVIVATLLGALVGGITAQRRQGTRLDIAQYAVGYALAFTVVGVFLAVAIDRMN